MGEDKTDQPKKRARKRNELREAGEERSARKAAESNSAKTPGAVETHIVKKPRLPSGAKVDTKRETLVSCAAYCNVAQVRTASAGFMAWSKANDHELHTRAEWAALFKTYSETKVRS